MVLGADVQTASPGSAETTAFRSWDELLSSQDRDLWSRRFLVAYPAGLIAGLVWGGWRGALAALLLVSSASNGMATSVYAGQSSEMYQKVTAIVAAVGVLEAAAALWLASSVANRKSEEGRSVWSLAR